jgi:hypothetical protein
MSLGNDRIARSNFRRYLIGRCGLSYGTASLYIWSLNTLSNNLHKEDIIDGSIYDIKNLHKLLDLKTKLSESCIYKEVNDRCRGNVTPSLRHYYNFMASNSTSDHHRDRHTKVLFQR